MLHLSFGYETSYNTGLVKRGRKNKTCDSVREQFAYPGHIKFALICQRTFRKIHQTQYPAHNLGPDRSLAGRQTRNKLV